LKTQAEDFTDVDGQKKKKILKPFRLETLKLLYSVPFTIY